MYLDTNTLVKVFRHKILSRYFTSLHYIPPLLSISIITICKQRRHTIKAASVQSNVGILNAGTNNQYTIYGRLLLNVVIIVHFSYLISLNQSFIADY